MDELRFDNRVAVVTGAGRGIGRAHALLLAARGAAVVVNDLGGGGDGTGAADSRPADDVVSEIVDAGGRAVANHGSVADEAGARSIVESARDAFGRIDILVNNAGIDGPVPFAELPVERFRRMWEVHALGTILTTMAAWPHMVEAGYGRIVNTGSGSMYGKYILPATDYGAAKGAVFGFTRNLAVETPGTGINVNCVLPGGYTRLSQAHWALLDQAPTEVNPPELVSPAVVYLAHESCELNGEVLSARGGRVSRIGTVEARGYASSDLTAEDVAAHIGEILDLFGAAPYRRHGIDLYAGRV
jgi:NAD(P)-dependent dehydrogenase (short-subunit alcohol dehydrogenase family)